MADEQITLGESKIEENSFENEYKGFISNRITELRLLKNISEYDFKRIFHAENGFVFKNM